MVRSRSDVKRSLVIAVSLLLVGFGYGFLSANRKVFPYRQLQALFASDEEAPPDRGESQAPMETGWWERVRKPGSRTEKEALTDLDKLGYGQSYELGSDRFGVTVYDAERAQDGLNLVVSAHEPAVLLTDMTGQTLHEWEYAFEDVPVPEDFEPSGTFGMRYFRRARLLPDGRLLAIYDRTALIELDRDSRLRWSLLGGYHHDLDVTADGTIWVLEHDVHVVPRIHESVPVFEDFVTRISPDGEVVGRVSLLEAFERSPYASFLAKARPAERADIFHTNTLEVFEGELAHLSPFFGAGMALVCIWGLDVVAIVDLEAGEVVWALSGLWHRPHEPVVLESGNLLVFDNMGHEGMSKVIELEPFTQRIVWSYEGNEENDFYTALCGSNQRLANGNTLITESLSGRAFEVTPGGEVVWRYLSPFRVGPEGEGVAVLMEVVRLERDGSLDWLD
jgi:hypothetical protein